MPEIHYAVIHSRGPRWDPAVPALEQPGLRDHVEHYRRLLGDGKLKLGGPFFDDTSGGIMVFESSVTEADARQLAAGDPAVTSGLLSFEVRPWAWVLKA